MTKDTQASAGEGVVFAATGEKYAALCRRAARNLRQVWPDVAIDLFCDTAVEDPIFDRIHRLEDVTRRPKMESLFRSRFERSVYLDADVIAVVPFPEVFEILLHYDIAGVQEQYGGAMIPMLDRHDDIPMSFRQFNSGVLGIRKSPETNLFLREWKRRFDEGKKDFDQPILRNLMFHSRLRIVTLPAEYNYMHLRFLANSGPRMIAPRLLHITKIHVGHDNVLPVDEPFDLSQFVNERVYNGIRTLIENDRTLGAKPSLRDFAGENVRKLPFGGQIMRLFSGRFRNVPWLR